MLVTTGPLMLPDIYHKYLMRPEFLNSIDIQYWPQNVLWLFDGLTHLLFTTMEKKRDS